MVRVGRGVAVGSTLAVVAGVCVVAPAQAAPLAMQGSAGLAAAEKLPDPWADKGGHSVSFAGGTGSTVEAVSGTELRVRLKGVAQAVKSTPNGTFSGLGKGQIAGAFADLKGKVKGVVTGRTTGGKPISVPVVFTSGVTGGKTKSVTVKPVGGQVPDELAEVFPQVGGVDTEMVGSKMRYVGVHATDGGAQTWRLSAATRSGALKTDGADGFTVRLPKAPNRGVGVQMGHEAASLPWSFVDKHWDNLEQGVAPTVIVQGIGKKSVVRTVALRPEKMKDGKTLVFRGEGLSSLSGKAKKALRTMRGASVTLVASNSGHEKQYVVITGDSIASGESGRYIADYEAANDYDNLGPVSAEKFCALVDLACTSAKDLTKANVAGPLQLIGQEYNEKPTLAYEKGSQGPGECHRSYSAPGTWLARYFSTQQGEKVGSINIACSGATTEAMTKPFNGQRPQAHVLSEISNVVHVPFVTNTMGANDIGFSAIAIGCYMKVAAPFLEPAEPGASLLDSIGAIIDAPWNPWFGYEKVKGEDKFEYKNPYCHNDPEIGGNAEKAIKTVPAKYEKAMNEVLDAAPHAKVVAANYPNLIPHNSQSNLPKTQVLAEDGPIHFLSDVGILGGQTIPEYPDFKTWSFAKLKANQKVWADFWSQVIMGGIAFGSMQNQLVSTMNLLLEKDMNWAAWKMIPDLNDAVFDTAKGMGGRVIPVDLRQVLNGREYANPYKGTSGVPAPQNLGEASWDNLGGMPHMGTVFSPPKAQYPPGVSADKLRATFVTAPLAGLPMQVPVLCPSNVTLNGKELEAGTCIGSMNEPLHPNWRGQAAQGQCYVAVVTGMAGEGNACVRSVGPNQWVVPEKGMLQVSWFQSIDPNDKLCVTAKPRDDYDWKVALPTKPYDNCSSDVPADPTWDTERWQTVKDHGDYK